jgi:hypothetical protein
MTAAAGKVQLSYQHIPSYIAAYRYVQTNEINFPNFFLKSVADAANKFDKNDLLLIHLLIYYFYTPNLP